MIQFITGDYEKKTKYSKNEKYIVSDFKSPKSFDQYDINIIDLTFDDLWRNNENSMNTINMIKDIKHYKKIIETTEKAKILLIFPQNIKFKSYYYNSQYHYAEDLKNLLDFVTTLVKSYINAFHFGLDFENTSTQIDDKNITADFYFGRDYIDNKHALLISDSSKKITTIRINSNLYYTTLDLTKSLDDLEKFLIKMKLINTQKAKRPKWVNDIDILDDIEIKNKMAAIDRLIEQKQIEKNNEIEKQEKNDKIKTILYETDKNLQNQVIEILNEMLDYNDDNFVDEMEEDFRIKKDNITFLIETKGLKRNVAGTDVSKTFNHVLSYEEKLNEENKENVKGILIVATQRDKCLYEREKTPDRQILIAERNNILIIRTEELLNLFEAFRNNKIKTDEIIQIFEEQTGEFKYNKE